MNPNEGSPLIAEPRRFRGFFIAGRTQRGRATDLTVTPVFGGNRPRVRIKIDGVGTFTMPRARVAALVDALESAHAQAYSDKSEAADER